MFSVFFAKEFVGIISFELDSAPSLYKKLHWLQLKNKEIMNEIRERKTERNRNFVNTLSLFIRLDMISKINL